MPSTNRVYLDLFFSPGETVQMGEKVGAGCSVSATAHASKVGSSMREEKKEFLCTHISCQGNALGKMLSDCCKRESHGRDKADLRIGRFLPFLPHLYGDGFL